MTKKYETERAKIRDKFKLTERQAAFCQAYVGEAKGNASEAYRVAGFAAENANIDSSKLLAKPSTQQAIAYLARPKEQKSIMSRKESLRILTDLGRGKLKQKSYTMHGEEVEQDPQHRDRLKAIELIGKMRGDFIERRSVEVSGKDGKPIAVETVNKLDFSKLSDNELVLFDDLLTKAKAAEEVI